VGNGKNIFSRNPKPFRPTAKTLNSCTSQPPAPQSARTTHAKSRRTTHARRGRACSLNANTAHVNAPAGKICSSQHRVFNIVGPLRDTWTRSISSDMIVNMTAVCELLVSLSVGLSVGVSHLVTLAACCCFIRGLLLDNGFLAPLRKVGVTLTHRKLLQSGSLMTGGGMSTNRFAAEWNQMFLATVDSLDFCVMKNVNAKQVPLLVKQEYVHAQMRKPIV